jgi:ATP-binding cassette subfamily B protein
VEREAERQAFAKACTYLNYHAGAKWAAHITAACTGVVYIAFLGVLWLFLDLMVSRGRLPDFHELTPPQQKRFLDDWANTSEGDRTSALEAVSPPGDPVRKLAKADVDSLSFEDRDALWRAGVRGYLKEIGPEAMDRAPLDKEGFTEADAGILSLVVRYHASGNMLTPALAWLARWNHWMWNARPEGRTIFPSFLTGLLLIGILLAILSAGLVLLMREMAARAAIEATTRLRRAVYHHTFRLGTLAIRALGPSEAVSIFTRHVEAVHDALYSRMTVFFREPIKFGLLLVFALVVQPWLALSFLLFAILMWLVGGQVAGYFRRQGRLATNQASERLTVIRESLMLMRLVKVYLMEQFNQDRVERQLSRYAHVQLVRYRGEAISQPLLLLLGALCALVLLFVAGIIVLFGQLAVPGVVVLATALLSLYRPMERWLEARKLLRRGRESALQVFKFLERRGEVGQVVGAEFLPPLAKQIEFDNVTLRDPSTNRTLLDEVSITIPAGQRIGLVGADDLEKQALVYLIPRLLDPTGGEIRVDQHNLRWVTLDSLRAQIATVLNHNLVFHDSVANNIGCGDKAFTLPQIIEAAKVAHAHHFIQKLPQGYETPIGELGHALSVSEQFRIALARAILRDPALLIIEEPDTAMDEDTKSLLDDTLTRVLPGRTAIFLPHRISTLRSCDRIYLIHKGRIAASGVHKELLAQNPLYRHLHYLEFNEMADQV